MCNIKLKTWLPVSLLGPALLTSLLFSSASSATDVVITGNVIAATCTINGGQTITAAFPADLDRNNIVTTTSATSSYSVPVTIPIVCTGTAPAFKMTLTDKNGAAGPVGGSFPTTIQNLGLLARQTGTLVTPAVGFNITLATGSGSVDLVFTPIKSASGTLSTGNFSATLVAIVAAQ